MRLFYIPRMQNWRLFRIGLSLFRKGDEKKSRVYGASLWGRLGWRYTSLQWVWG